MPNPTANCQLPPHRTDSPATGIYIHVPFCRAKCSYCDFYSVTDLGLIPDYLDALSSEISRYRQKAKMVDTIYFGGGTPSVLAPRQVGRILEHLDDCFKVLPQAEITLEVNPGTVDPEKLAAFRTSGVNRLSIGLQSLDEKSLRFLGRIHSVRQGLDTYRWARTGGFDNVSLDLIYAIPGQTRKRWEAELTDGVNLGAEHLSCYTLTVAPGTPLGEKVCSGRIQPLDEGLAGDLFSLTIDTLNASGYLQYEISNFARRSADTGIDHRSRHNRKYWTFAPYLGFGPAAHSFQSNRRWWNRQSLDGYLAAVRSGASPMAQMETLTHEQQILEYLYLGLRQRDGLDAADFETRFGTRLYRGRESAVSHLIAEGLLESSPRGIRTTTRGMRFLEHVVDRLIV